ncbi:MAG TPA: ADP-ribosylglycohydrolase family protein [Bacteroidota bacterium]|nr:ADP-ribosylglycohydrolase family protein [Bacteroidota bacterium]
MNDDAKQRLRAALLGAVVGDAIGVPFEFLSREQARSRFTCAMTGYGTYDQPPGTWSDDSSMLLCTAEVYAKGFSLPLLADTFVRWMNQAHMTPHGQVFDCGITTSSALRRYHAGAAVTACGCREEACNGNGSLMRIAPVALFHAYASQAELCSEASAVSAITHAHPRSRLACVMFSLLLADTLRTLSEQPSADPHDTLHTAIAAIHRRYRDLVSSCDLAGELPGYHRIFLPAFKELTADKIHSDGYVVHTLEAALWCALRGASFKDVVCQAVRLGNDSDTTACVAGALAGVMYGMDGIPTDWLHGLQAAATVHAVVDAFVDRVDAEWTTKRVLTE